MMQKRVAFLQFHVLYLFTTVCYSYTMQVHTWDYSQDKPYGSKCAMLSTWNTKDNIYETSVTLSCTVNTSMSLRC